MGRQQFLHLRRLARAVLLVVGCAYAAGCWAAGSELAGRVVRVSDGDTITVLDATNAQHRIRLAGIDAPESSQAFGKVSRANLSHLVAGRTVRVVERGRDRYQRILGVVYVDELDCNLQQLKDGMIWGRHGLALPPVRLESRLCGGGVRGAGAAARPVGRSACAGAVDVPKAETGACRVPLTSIWTFRRGQRRQRRDAGNKQGKAR